VRADVTFEPDGERMAMVLSVADEGSEVRIKSLRLVGEDDAKAATVLAGLPFAPDTLATSATLAGLQRDLEATGRYLTVKVEIPNDAPAVLDPLAIAVEPSPGVLPEASQRDVDQARKALDAQIARLRRGDTLQVDFALAEAQQCGEYLRLGPGTVSIRLSRDGYALEATNLQWGGQPPVAAALHLDMNTGTISCTVGAATSSWQLPVGALQVKVLTKPSQDGRMLIGYEVGFQSHAAAMVDVDLHPATALHLVGRAAKVQRDGDVMILDFGSTKVRIDANGQLAEDHFTFVSEDMPMEASWLQAGFGAPPRAATMDDPRALLALGNMLLTDALPADVLRDGADRRVPARAHAGRREPPDRRQDRTRAPAAGPEQRHASDALHGPWRDPRETGRESAVQRVARGPFRRFRLIIARQQYAFREASAHGAAPRRTRSTVDGDHVRGLAPARRRGAHGGVSATR